MTRVSAWERRSGEGRSGGHTEVWHKEFGRYGVRVKAYLLSDACTFSGQVDPNAKMLGPRARAEMA